MISSKDLASLLNLSPSTVSMVLNNKPGISEETRIKVLETAKEYGYNFSKYEQTPKSGVLVFVIYKKHGAVVSDTPFFSQVTEGIEQGCRNQNCSLQIQYFYENQNAESQIKALNELNCIGIVLLGTEMNENDFDVFSEIKVPLVVLDCYYDRLTFDAVLINNVQGAFLATNYLIEKGNKKIGYIHSSISISNFSERANGYYKALRYHKIPTDHPYVFEVASYTEKAYLDMCAYLKSKREMPECFFADNDLIAAACMRALSEHGYNIPDDISIIGFDNMPFCEFLSPPLATMNVQKQTLGLMAVNRLMEKVNISDKQIIKLELSTSIIERKSVADRK